MLGIRCPTTSPKHFCDVWKVLIESKCAQDVLSSERFYECCSTPAKGGISPLAWRTLYLSLWKSSRLRQSQPSRCSHLFTCHPQGRILKILTPRWLSLLHSCRLLLQARWRHVACMHWKRSFLASYFISFQKVSNLLIRRSILFHLVVEDINKGTARIFANTSLGLNAHTSKGY